MIDEKFLDVVFVMLLVTATLGPIMTQRYAPLMLASPETSVRHQEECPRVSEPDGLTVTSASSGGDWVSAFSVPWRRCVGTADTSRLTRTSFRAPLNP